MDEYNSTATTGESSSSSTLRAILSPRQTKGTLKQLWSRRNSYLSPDFTLQRKRFLDGHADTAKDAVLAAIQGKIGPPPLLFGDDDFLHPPTRQAKELLTPQETQTRKATALKEIRKTLQAQQQQELQAKRRLIEFLQGGRKQRPTLKPQGSDAAIRYDATDRKSLEEEEDDVSMEKEKEDTPPPRTTATTKPARKRKLPRTPQQVKLAQQAHRLLKSINHEKRFEVIRQTCKRGLAKHAARQTNKKLCSDWEARIHVMKQAVKQALLRSHSQEDMACVMQQLLASASRKNFKLQLAIQMQAMIRGYLVRRKQLLLVKQ